LSQPATSPDENGKTLLGTVNNLGTKLIGTTPPVLIFLVLITAVFNLGLLWFMDQREKQRERIFAPYLQACEKQMPIEAMDKLFEHFKELQQR